MNNRLLYIGCICIILILTSCVSNVEEELYPEPCDTLQVTYALTISPIIELNCYQCHSGDDPLSGIRLDGYSNLKVQVDNERLIGALRHQEGYSPMPEPIGSPTLPECNLLQIEKWVVEGALDN